MLSAGCATEPGPKTAAADEDAPMSQPSPEIRAWMDRLTVEHAYDPQTGFIVARQTIPLPPLIAAAPALDEAVVLGAERGAVVIAFATADRCAPCQQYKKDALNDPGVLDRLSDPRLIATHVEVDRQPGLADRYLGSRAIPMTYAIRDGRVFATLRGQRSAADLLAWLDALPAS